MTLIRELAPTMLVDGAGSLSQFADFGQWWDAMRDAWATGESVAPVVMGYYKACDVCGWADPSTHKTIEEAKAVCHTCPTAR